MSFGLRTLEVVALGGFVLLAGCAKKKPVAVAPQAQAPAVVTTAPLPTPAEAQPAANAPSTQPEATPAPTQPPQKLATKPKPKHHNQVAKHTPPTPKPAETATAKANVPIQSGPPQSG